MINKIFNFINKHLYLIIIIVLMIQVSLIFSNQFIRLFNSDEFESIHYAWKLTQGENLYTDFFEHHHPLFYQMLTPLVHAGQDTLNTLYYARIFIFINLLIIYFLTYQIARHIKDKKMALLSLLILNNIVYFVVTATEIRPDNFQVTFCLLSLWLLFLFIKNKNKPFFYLSSVSLGIAFLFLQKTIFFIAPIFLILLHQLRQKTISIYNILFYILVFVITISPYYIYLLSNNYFEIYILNFWLFNFYVRAGNPILFLFYLSALATSISPWFLFFVGVIKSLKSQNILIIYASIIVGAILLAIVPTPFKLNQYLTITGPPMAIVAAYGLRKIKFFNKITYGAILFILCLFPLAFLVIIQIKDPNYKQLERMKYVLNETSKDDYVFGGNYLNLFRKDIDYLWFGLHYTVPAMNKLTGYEYDIYKSIDEKKPKVIWQSNLRLNDPRIKENYSFSEVYDDILIRNQ